MGLTWNVIFHQSVVEIHSLTTNLKFTYLGENVVNENEYLSAMVRGYWFVVRLFAGAKWWRKFEGERSDYDGTTNV